MDRVQFDFEIMCLSRGLNRPGQNLAIQINNQLSDMRSRQFVKMLGECLVEQLGGEFRVLRNMEGAVRFDLKNADASDFERALDFLLNERG